MNDLLVNIGAVTLLLVFIVFLCRYASLSDQKKTGEMSKSVSEGSKITVERTYENGVKVEDCDIPSDLLKWRTSGVRLRPYLESSIGENNVSIFGFPFLVSRGGVYGGRSILLGKSPLIKSSPWFMIVRQKSRVGRSLHKGRNLKEDARMSDLLGDGVSLYTHENSEGFWHSCEQKDRNIALSFTREFFNKNPHMEWLEFGETHFAIIGSMVISASALEVLYQSAIEIYAKAKNPQGM